MACNILSRPLPFSSLPMLVKTFMLLPEDCKLVVPSAGREPPEATAARLVYGLRKLSLVKWVMKLDVKVRVFELHATDVVAVALLFRVTVAVGDPAHLVIAAATIP